jgi:hypothetical protein
MATITPKWIHKPGLIKVRDLPVGKFGSINGHIIYRYIAYSKDKQTWLPGLLFIEHHNHLDIYDAATEVDNEWQYLCEVVEFPEKKHCDNAIAMIRKLGKEGKIDGLAYVDHFSTLKQYIKDYLERKVKV